MHILVIRFSSLGDVVLATGALRAVGHAHPDARLTFLTKPDYLPLLENLDIPVHAPQLHPQRLVGSAHQALSGIRFDCVLDLHASVRSIALSRVLPTRRRIQVQKHTARRRAMVKSKTGLDHPLSVVQVYCEALERLKSPLNEIQPRLFLSGDEAAQADSMHRTEPVTLAIGWGARWPTKAVPPRVWTALLAALGSDHFSAIRFFGLDTDRPAIESFITDTELGNSSGHVECGHPLRAVMTRLAACSAFIGSDSGLMHIAAALGLPTIGLFGPTHPALGFAPVGENATHFHAGTYCSPCHRHGAAPCFRGHRYCFDELDIPTIAASVRDALAKPWSLPHAISAS